MMGEAHTRRHADPLPVTGRLSPRTPRLVPAPCPACGSRRTRLVHTTKDPDGTRRDDLWRCQECLSAWWRLPQPS